MNEKLYTIAANAILVDLIADIRESVPNIFDYQGRLLGKAPSLAGKYGKSAVDALLAVHGLST